MTRILVNSETKLDQCIEAVINSGTIILDTETNGLDLWHGDRMVGIALLPDFNRVSYYIPFRHGIGVFKQTTQTAANERKAKLTNERYKDLPKIFIQLPPERVLAELDHTLTPDKTYIMHNAQFDLTALLQDGIDLTGATVLDTMLAARTLYSDFNRSWFKMPDSGQREKGNNSLKWLSRLFGLVQKTDDGIGDERALTQAMKDLKTRLGKNTLNLNIKKHLWALPPEDVAPYACQDVEITKRLHDVLLGQLASWQQVDVYKLMCEHQMSVAWPMHCTGFKIDHERGNQLMVDYEAERAALLEGVDFNINSADAIARYAARQNVNLPLTPKGNPKTDKKTLKDCQDQAPLFKNILAVRALDKNVGTYIKKWLDNTTPNKPLHPSFNVLGTVTGRWSSSDKIAGNLQNIPKDTKLKYNPKKLLLPLNPEYQIVEIDYSQLEMRVGAWVAETLVGQGQDMTLTNLILDGVDMHAYTRDQAGICEYVTFY
jgi:DNA polymerase I-like protein with 3'-5' exonuclease and polymerase domains